jgi:hypothetical protein
MNELETLVKGFNDYADLNGLIFGHGFTYDINQLQNEGDNNITNTFLHLYEVEPTPEVIDPYGFDWGVFRVNFFIGMNSIVNEQFYKANKGVASANGYKFDKYYVPSFTACKEFINSMSNCNDFEMRINSMPKKQNYQDANMDGFLISATVRLINKIYTDTVVSED